MIALVEGSIYLFGEDELIFRLSFLQHLILIPKKKKNNFRSSRDFNKSGNLHHHSLFLGLLHLLLHLEELIFQLLLVLNQVLHLLLQLVLQVLDNVVNFGAVPLMLLEDLQLCLQLFVLVFQMFHLLHTHK